MINLRSHANAHKINGFTFDCRNKLTCHVPTYFRSLRGAMSLNEGISMESLSKIKVVTMKTRAAPSPR
jgi:hypothetical protein